MCEGNTPAPLFQKILYQLSCLSLRRTTSFDGFRNLSLYSPTRLGPQNSPKRLQKGPTLLHFEPIDQFEQRLKKLHEIESLGYSPYPRRFDFTHTAKQIVDTFADASAEQLSLEPKDVRVAGRIVALRPHGKAAFGHILGDGKRLQFYVKLDIV